MFEKEFQVDTTARIEDILTGSKDFRKVVGEDISAGWDSHGSLFTQHLVQVGSTCACSSQNMVEVFEVPWFVKL